MECSRQSSHLQIYFFLSWYDFLQGNTCGVLLLDILIQSCLASIHPCCLLQFCTRCGSLSGGQPRASSQYQGTILVTSLTVIMWCNQWKLWWGNDQGTEECTWWYYSLPWLSTHSSEVSLNCITLHIHVKQKIFWMQMNIKGWTSLLYPETSKCMSLCQDKQFWFFCALLFVQMRSQCRTSTPSYSSNGQLKRTVTTGLSKMHHMLLVCEHNLTPWVSMWQQENVTGPANSDNRIKIISPQIILIKCSGHHYYFIFRGP